MATSKFPMMNWESPNLAESLKLFKQKMNLVCEDHEMTNEEKIARKIKIGLGDEGLQRLNASGHSEENLKSPARIWTFLEGQLKVAINFRIERLALMQYRQTEGETLDEFVVRARTQALRCEFTDEELQERTIELIIASTPMELFRRDLLSKDANLKLEDAVKLGRQHEAAQNGTQQIELLVKPQEIHAVNQGEQKHKEKLNSCGNCGRRHKYKECPAYKSR